MPQRFRILQIQTEAGNTYKKQLNKIHKRIYSCFESKILKSIQQCNILTKVITQNEY